MNIIISSLFCLVLLGPNTTASETIEKHNVAGSNADENREASVTATVIHNTDIVIDPWTPATSSRPPSVQDLHREYSNIFRYGNRNAASHLWSTFLLERARQMTKERLQFFFTGFCAVSGSPIRPNDYNRYQLTLPKVSYSSTGGKQKPSFSTGFMHYCCWPCVCDTQDFIRVDTLNVTYANGITRKEHFTVIGNPCNHPEKLREPFHQPFGRGTTTLAAAAPEVRCLEGGMLKGATLSDHGHIIISMFFDARAGDSTDTSNENDRDNNHALTAEKPQPGRISSITIAVDNDKDNIGNDSSTSEKKTILFQDEREWVDQCTDRAANGYNSGMGEIFRQVSAISPIPFQSSPMELLSATVAAGNTDKTASCDPESESEIVS
mmetsp:Transcript_7176/g.9308  ORF Transcript_7176/g.9308 Transcript_7176/m.9308 type:complete len:380 (+) Transcript_7176:91-1230(+)